MRKKTCKPMTQIWWVFGVVQLKVWHWHLVINNTLNLLPMVDFLLQGKLGVKPLFIWGVEKCLETSICHPLRPEWDLVLKNMKIMWEETSPRFRQLSPSNTLLIDDCTYKCIGNPPFSYILAQPYNNLVSNNYLLENLCPYFVGLFKVQSTLGYVGLSSHG